METILYSAEYECTFNYGEFETYCYKVKKWIFH
jgi:hypothetical protein